MTANRAAQFAAHKTGHMTYFEIDDADSPTENMVCNLPTTRRERLFQHYVQEEAPSPLKKTLTLRAKLLVFDPLWLVIIAGAVTIDLFVVSVLLGLEVILGMKGWQKHLGIRGDFVSDLVLFEFLWLCLLTPVYMINVGAKLKVFRCSFCSRPSSLMDGLAALSCCYAVVADRVDHKCWEGLFYLDQLGRCLRLCRGLLLLTKIGKCPCLVAIRRIVSGNKRRYVSISEDLDLDLTYITPRIIAFAAPGTHCSDVFFRNLFSEVVRFFELRHSHRYLIVNCCPEKPYDEKAFHCGQIVHFDIQDHTPPTMQQFLDFLELASQWLEQDSDNIVGVHCMGGKGRTGSFVSALLLFSGASSTLQGALEIFALSRTQLGGKRHLVGVETPSQLRYLSQLSELLIARGHLPDRSRRDGNNSGGACKEPGSSFPSSLSTTASPGVGAQPSLGNPALLYSTFASSSFCSSSPSSASLSAQDASGGGGGTVGVEEEVDPGLTVGDGPTSSSSSSSSWPATTTAATTAAATAQRQSSNNNNPATAAGCRAARDKDGDDEADVLFNRAMLRPIPPVKLLFSRIVLRKVFTEKFVRKVRGLSAPLVLAFHIVRPEVGHKVVWWSNPFKPELLQDQEIPVDCDLLQADVRVSLFLTTKLERARARNRGMGAFRGDTVQDSHRGLVKHREPRRCKGGSEPGCLFFFIFHTAFVSPDGPFNVKIGAEDGEMAGTDGAYLRPDLYNSRGSVELHFQRVNETKEEPQAGRSWSDSPPCADF